MNGTKGLLTTLALGAALIAAWAIGGDVLVRSIVILPLAFLVPGVLLISLLTARLAFGFEYWTFAVGLSLATTAVVGLALHLVGALNAIGWCAAFTLISFCALWRNWKSARSVSQYCGAIGSLFTGENKHRIVVCAAVAALASSSVALASYGARQHHPFAYTELWLQPYDGRDLQRVLVGVRNQENATLRYELEILTNDRILVRLPQFDLFNGEQRVEDIPIPTEWTRRGRLEARLYRVDQPTLIYRRTWLSTLAQGS